MSLERLAPTEQQKVAIHTLDRALVMEAGAGTGKTWVLVRRFLHLLETYPDWSIDSIVAITFTEKAAREMRNRIRAGVEDRAREATTASFWQQHRQQLDRLQVGTIHNLCARILRENAIAAGIDPQFEVLDEEEAGLLAEAAIRQTLADLAAGDHPALALLATLSVRDVEQELGNLLQKRGIVAQLFGRLADRNELLARWQQGIVDRRRQVWRRLRSDDPALAMAVETVPRLHDLPEDDKLVPYVKLAQEGCSHLREENWAQAFEALDQIDLRSGSGKKWGKERLAQVKEMLKALRNGIRALQSKGLLDDVGPLDEQAAYELRLWRSLWQALTVTYDRLKAERHSLDFDDLELLTDHLLQEDPRSERLQAFRDSIHHVMVDEYQDTNPIQRRIVYQLAHPTEPGRLFVVGDAKQSIYRFRQAQVRNFNRTARDVEETTGYPAQPLNLSFRAHQSLVDALNHLFGHILKPLNGSDYQDYEARPGALDAHRQEPPDRVPTSTPVELWLVPKEDEAGETVDAAAGRIWEAHLLAERLLQLHEEETLIWDPGQKRHRPFKFKDAAVLFRATTNLPLYEEVFKQKGLPYLSISGRGYYDRPEVQDLLALLTLLRNPGDDLHLAAALRSPLFGLSDETLYRLRWRTADDERPEQPRPLREALTAPPPTDQEQDVVAAHEILEELWGLAGQVDVWRLLRRALDRTAYEVTLARNDAEKQGSGRQLNNVYKFLGIARDRDGASLSDFLRRVGDLRTAEAREGEAQGREPQSGAVHLMSIHASKGLEFPVVAVADLGRRRRSGSDGFFLCDPAFGMVCKVRDEEGDWQKPASYNWAAWLDEQMDLAEDKRLLYVACTRAADLLLLSGRVGEKTSWLADILSTWQIAEEDEAAPAQAIYRPDEENFQVRINRPAERPVETPPSPTDMDGRAGLDVLPVLARPLPRQDRDGAETVTVYVREAEWADNGETETPPLYPAVHGRQAGSAQSAPAPPVSPSLVGKLVHRALADWHCLALPASELDRYLRRIALSVGIAGDRAVADAAQRAYGMVRSLQRSELYRDVEQATVRHHEVPFTLETSRGTLQGAIDLLYRDGDGSWRLLDWKTEWAPAGQLDEQAAYHLPQLAIYHLAARRILDIRPQATVCFLGAGAALRRYEDREIDAALRELGVLS